MDGAQLTRSLGKRSAISSNPCARKKRRNQNNKIPTPDAQQLEIEEKQLGIKLRSLCLPSGEEKRKTLEDSAGVLLNLGNVYLKKAVHETSIEQKMSYIKCAVLLHAAIERFKIVENSEKIQASKQVCQEMSKNVLKSCGSICQTPLLDISERLFQSVCKKRTVIKRFLDTGLCQDGDNEPHLVAKHLSPEKLEAIESMESTSYADIKRILSPDGEEMEKRSTQKVQEVNKSVTTFFKGIMCNIATACLDLLPAPPCKFSIVGLGSLAREEVTLYSDFEHVILLEDGIDGKENNQSILEYFRWFSVVFQLIIIGFGETIIPSVAVKSLNDSYSGDARLNWYYDNYTPKGISFDGMLPHACKIPLGRQHETRNRSHIVELIKTPRKMARYLTQNEHLKNGYHLADVLRQTCLVYGDSGIYASFLNKRDHILQKDKTTIHNIYSEMILRNSTPYVHHKNLERSFAEVFDSKAVYYRPFATYISTIARIYKLEEKSTFATIDELYKLGILRPYTYNKLKYAFAVACAIRMKLYHKANQQRHGTQLGDVNVMMGKEAVRVSRDVLTCLKAVTDDLIEREDLTALSYLEVIFTDSDSPFAVSCLGGNEYIDEAIGLGERLLEHQRTGEKKYADAAFEDALFDLYHHALISSTEHRLEYYHKAKALYLKLSKQVMVSETIDLDLSMLDIYTRMGKFQEGMMTCERLLPKYFQAVEQDIVPPDFIVACYTYHSLVLNLSPRQADKKLQAVLWDKTDNIECKLLKHLHLIHRSFNRGHPGEEIREELCSISSAVQKNARNLHLPVLLHNWIVNAQVRLWWLEDAVETLESASKHYRTRSSWDQTRENSIQILDSLRLLCLCRLHGNRCAQQLATNSRCVEMNNEQRNQALLKCLVRMLWRGVNLSSHQADLIIVLTWVIHLKATMQLRSVFCIHQELKYPIRAYKKGERIIEHFQKRYSKRVIIDRKISTSFVLLLLANYLCKDP